MRKIDVFKKGVIATLFLLLSVHFGVGAQNVAVSGQVLDSSGLPLPGVNIVVEGTATGTISDFDGNYSITVAPDAVLVFNFIGFQAQNVPVEGRALINVVMEEDFLSLSEVVVVGYGTQRREAVTGSVATVRGDQLREVASANVTQALQGRVSGVEMSQVSSKPGAEMQIRVRGTRSLNASNDPLIVLDGIPFAGKIGDISPSDIKSLDILKDASATAIYGSRGANGVILITTNKGQKGQEARVTYNAYTGVKTLFNEYPMMNSVELADLREAAGLYSNSLDESIDNNTNWQDLMYENGIVNSHDLGVSGGTENANYNFGIGYYKDESLLPGQNYDRYSLRAAIDQQVGQYFNFGFTTNTSYSTTNGADLGLYNTLSASPLASPYNADGSLKRIISMPSDDQWVYTRESIENLGDGWAHKTRGFGTYNSLYGEVEAPWVEGLKYRVNLGLNYRQENHGRYTGEGVFNVTPDNPSTAAISNAHTTNWVVENLLTYDRAFGKHNFNVVALYSAEETTYFKSELSARDVPSDHLQFYNLGHADGELSVNPDNQDYYKSGLSSWMGRVMYAYDNKYMLSVALRSDGSSRLAPGYEWHTYPAVSAGWNIKNEAFMDNVVWLNQLKLRVGYGQTSNQSIDPYSTLGRLSTRPYNFGDSFATGFYVSELPNPNLGWEFTETMNYGLDFSLLSHRLSGTFEYYQQTTKDLLFRVNLPSTSGVGSYMANIGESENKGFELSLNGVIVDDRNGWSWDAGINLYANRNKLTKLASGQERDENNWWFVGHPIDVIFDYEKVGLWQEDDAHRDILEPGGNAGMIKVKYTGEYNADGTPVRAIGPDDRQILSLEPKFQGGFNTRVAYKNWDLSVVGAFKKDGVLISTLHSSSGYLNMMSGRRNNVKVDYWTPENTGAKYPKPGGVVSNDNPKYGSTLGYFDATYMKVRTITLGYNFNKSLLDNFGIERLRMYATIQNPFVMFSPFKDETGLDPETNSYGDENAAVTTQYKQRLLTVGTNSPATRNFLFGLNLTF
ncbi:SusC/RagA family TonB-linked outer membrane protein [Geofilum rhodophaeum]|uniref:SusC/RagA family TonB-linked outer membrane protein n=1 Tax=Geofilum rhodophaeum TaxID=1965019 RepID=UPI000B522FD9|nr:TonB-dependent receptor [Geofilum rhodophaeum]